MAPAVTCLQERLAAVAHDHVPVGAAGLVGDQRPEFGQADAACPEDLHISAIASRQARRLQGRPVKFDSYSGIARFNAVLVFYCFDTVFPD